jgi:hypothetical protein
MYVVIELFMLIAIIWKPTLLSYISEILLLATPIFGPPPHPPIWISFNKPAMSCILRTMRI